MSEEGLSKRVELARERTPFSERMTTMERIMIGTSSKLENHKTLIQSMHSALQRHLEESEDDGPHKSDYKFRTSSLGVISLVDIAADVDRSNPVVEVVVQGAEYNKFHKLLIHHMFKLKFDVLMSKDLHLESNFLRTLNIVFQNALFVTPSVLCLDLTKSTFTFAEIRAALLELFEFPLHCVGETAHTIVVRYR